MGNTSTRISVSEIEEPFKNREEPNKTGLQLKISEMGTTAGPEMKKINYDDETQIFPPEVILEILSWLPIKSLIQLQLVSKKWQAFAHDHYFIEKHMSHWKVDSYWYNTTSDSPGGRDKPKTMTFAYIHGCDGLILIRNNVSFIYFLWNPATRRVIQLPDSQRYCYGKAISFVAAGNGSYRIVSFYKDKESAGEGCEILTPGLNQEWRRLPFPSSTANLNGCKKEKRVTVVSTGGSVHCVFIFQVGEEIVAEIVSLDTETEHFTVNHLPKGLFRDLGNVHLLDWNGKLGFVDIVGRNLEVIELSEYKKQRWCGDKKVIPLFFMKEGDGESKWDVTPLFAKEGEIWFWLKDEKIFTYAFKTGKTTDVKDEKSFSVRNKPYLYKPSLISFEGMQPDDMLKALRHYAGLS